MPAQQWKESRVRGQIYESVLLLCKLCFVQNESQTRPTGGKYGAWQIYTINLNFEIVTLMSGVLTNAWNNEIRFNFLILSFLCTK